MDPQFFIRKGTNLFKLSISAVFTEGEYVFKSLYDFDELKKSERKLPIDSFIIGNFILYIKKLFGIIKMTQTITTLTIDITIFAFLLGKGIK